MKKRDWKNGFVFWILLTEAVGLLAGWLTREGTAMYGGTMTRPPLSPPGIVFPIVWTVLYALMGIGAALVYQSPASAARTRGLTLFFVQLAFNFLWSIIFFNLQSYGLALVWLIALWGLILAMTLAFRRVDRTAARMQVPYLLWAAFAAYLNAGVWYLN